MLQKEISIEIDYSSWHSRNRNIPSNFMGKNGNSVKFDLIDVLLHIGLITKHPEDYGVKINSFWAILRYLNCFESGTRFHLNEKFGDVDAHQKTILSDDFGMGFASYYLTKELNLISIVDTGYFLKHLPSLSINKKSKRGPSKTPDFIMLDQNYELHLLECKGTQTDLAKSNAQIENGIPQVVNIKDPNGIISQQLVTGIFIPQYKSKQQSRFKIIDPEFTLDLSNTNKIELINKTFQGQLAKELHFLGLTELANKIANEKSLKEIRIETLFDYIFKKKNVLYRPFDQVNQSELEFEIGYDLNYLERFREVGVENLLEMFEEIRSKKFSNDGILNDTKRKNRMTNSQFGLYVTVNRF